MPDDEYTKWRDARNFEDYAKKRLTGQIPPIESKVPPLPPTLQLPTPGQPQQESPLQTYLQDIDSSLIASGGDILSNIGSTAKWAQSVFGAPTTSLQNKDVVSPFGGNKSIADLAIETGERISREAQPEPYQFQEGANLGETIAKNVTNPEFWTKGVARQVPNMLTLLIPGIGAEAGATRFATAVAPTLARVLGPRLAGLAVKVGPKIAAGASSRVMESALEAGQAYTSALDSGMDEDAARKAGNEVFKGNLKLAPVDVLEWAIAMPGLPKASQRLLGNQMARSFGQQALPALKILGGLTATGAMEGAEEGYQDYVQRTALKQPFQLGDPQSMQAMLMGGAMGAAMGGGGRTIGALAERGVKPLQVAKALAPGLTVEDVSGGKQPWQMSAKEFDADLAARRKATIQEWNAAGSKGFPPSVRPTISEVTPLAEQAGYTFPRDADIVLQKPYHRLQVEAALNQGKPVPPEVLADYPDLARQQQQPPAAAVGKQSFASRLGVVGQEVTMVDVPSILERSETIGGVRYDLFRPVADGGFGTLRVSDLDSEEVVGIRQRKTFQDAETEYEKALATERLSAAEQPPLSTEGPTGAVVPPPATAPEAPSAGIVMATGADPNKTYQFRYRVVPLDSLVASHDDNFTRNPAFPKELQPRLRSRTASQMQVNTIASTLNPAALIEDVGQIDRGPMIVGPDNVVESGNGRTLALRLARQQYPDKWNAYQQALQAKLGELGIDPASVQGMADPVLVRERVDDVDRAEFAKEANEATILGMSTIEQALADVNKVSDEAVANFVVGENQSVEQALLASENQELVRGFVQALPANERAGVVDANGRINQQGLLRIKAALFAKTYPGEAGQRLTNAFFESIDPTVRTIETGMFSALPAMARAEGLVRSGSRNADLSIGEDLAKAVDVLARLRKESITVADYLAQGSMWERELTPLQESLLQFLSGVGRSSKKVRDFLSTYSQSVENSPDPNQMATFEMESPTKEALVESAKRKTEPEGGNGPLFATVAETTPATTQEVAQTTPVGQVSPQLERGLLEPSPEPAPAESVTPGETVPTEVTEQVPTSPVPPSRQAALAEAERAQRAKQRGPQVTQPVEQLEQQAQAARQAAEAVPGQQEMFPLETGRASSEGEPPSKQPPLEGMGPMGDEPTDGPAQLKAVRNSLADKNTPLMARVPAWWRHVIRSGYDRMHDLLPVQKLTGIETYYMARLVSSAAKKAESILLEQVQPVVDGLGKDAKYLEEYMTIQREKDILGRNSEARLPGGVTHPTAAETALAAELGPGGMQAIRDAADKMWQFNLDQYLGDAQRSGRLSAEGVKALHDAYPHYIPFFRQDYDTLDSALNFMAATGASKPADLPAAFSKAMDAAGSEKNLSNPLARFYASFIRSTVANAKNDSARTMVAALEEYQGRLGLDLVRKAEGPIPSDFQKVTWWDKGANQERYVANPFAAIAKGTEKEGTNWFWSFLRASSAPLRYGAVQANQTFLFVNTFRDAMSAWEREGLVPFANKHYWQGLKAAITKNERWHEAARAGVLLSGWNEMAMRTSELGTAKRMIGGIPLQKPTDWLLVVPRLIMRGNEISEEATRIAVYEHLKGNKELTNLERIIRSRDATVDFDKSGNWVRLLNQMIPFLNAGVQGTANTIRIFKDNPKAAVARMMPLVAVSMAAMMWNLGHDTGDKIPDYEYANNWIFWIAEGTKNPDPKFPNAEPEKFPVYLKIPKGPMFSFLMAPIESALRIAWNKDDRSALELIGGALGTMATAMSPIEPSVTGLIPPVLSTPASIAVNKDFFRNQDIVPEREMTRPPEERYGAEASKTAIALGEQFKLSPRLIDFAISDYVGGAGKTTSWIADTVLGGVGYNPTAPGEATRQSMTAKEEAALLPIASRFVGTKSSQEFRTNQGRLNDALDDSRRLLYQNPEARRFALGVNPITDSVTINGVATQVPDDLRLQMQRDSGPLVKSALDAVTTSPFYQKLSDAEKRKAIDLARSKVGDHIRERAIDTINGETPQPLWSAADMPEMAQAMDLYYQYQAMPRYRGISADQMQGITEASRVVNAYAARLPQGTKNVGKVALAQALRDNPEMRQYLLLIPTLRKRIDPRRSQFWKQNVALLDKYFGSGEVIKAA
jgi:hypothetical protein